MPSGVRLILASASPRRRDLLAEAGYRFEVDVSGVDEAALSVGVDPHALPQVLAEAKAGDVARRHAGAAAVVLAADTVVYAHDQVLGKPADRADAGRMIRLLSGSLQTVVTGWCAIRCDAHERLSGRVRSDVLMRPIDDDEIERYLDTDQWQGKAGGYGIQDGPGEHEPFVEQISGELSNIVGLPMPQVVDALRELGVGRDLD